MAYIVCASSGQAAKSLRPTGRFTLGGGAGTKDNAREEAGAVYGAIDTPWAKLVAQVADAYRK